MKLRRRIRPTKLDRRRQRSREHALLRAWVQRMTPNEWTKLWRTLLDTFGWTMQGIGDAMARFVEQMKPASVDASGTAEPGRPAGR